MMGVMGRGFYGYGGDLKTAPEYMQKMMQNYYGGSSFLWQFAGILDFVVQILFIVLLVAVIRWAWKKGSKS